MRITCTHTIDGLASDLARLPVNASTGFARAVRSSAEMGNDLARTYARDTAGAHGKHYPNAMSAEAITALSWEYGPDSAMPQGGMSFEYGSRNQPPHLDLARSADLAGPELAKQAGSVLDGLFW